MTLRAAETRHQECNEGSSEGGTEREADEQAKADGDLWSGLKGEARASSVRGGRIA